MWTASLFELLNDADPFLVGAVDVAHRILVAPLAKYSQYEFGRVSGLFTELLRILETGSAAIHVLCTDVAHPRAPTRTTAAKRSRAPANSDAAGYFTSIVERLDRRDRYSHNMRSRRATAERKSKSRASMLTAE